MQRPGVLPFFRSDRNELYDLAEICPSSPSSNKICSENTLQCLHDSGAGLFRPLSSPPTAEGVLWSRAPSNDSGIPSPKT